MKRNYITLAILSAMLLAIFLTSQAEKQPKEPTEEAEVIATIKEPTELKLVPILEEAEQAEEQQSIDDMIVEIAGMYNICPELIYAVCEAESGMNPEAVSECGAIGLMQIVPKWHQERMQRLGVMDLKNPYDNILVGTDIIAELFKTYGDDVYKVLMCYNEGKYGTACQRADAGEYSHYSRKIVERSAELERLHEKEDK